MKKVIFATGVAVLALASVVGAQGYVFSTNLTVGSTGPAVVALQTALIASGHTIPSIASGAAAKGYFGSQTQTAVKAYQSSKGIPSTGFVGPLTRAALNGGVVVGSTSGAGCPAGYVCTPTTGSSVTGSMGGITTAGVPGIMTVTSGPLSSSVLNVGKQMAPIQTIRVQAQYSDLDVQSITLDIGNNTAFYNKLFNTIYVTDGTNVLATQPVNGSTAVQSGSEYLLGIAGFHFIVTKGTYKDLVIKGSLNSSIDSAYITGNKVPNVSNGLTNSINGTAVNGWGIGVVANGVRAVDGAGLNLYGPTTGIVQTLTVNTSLVDSAQANISLDAASPLVASIPVSDTTNGQYLGLPIFAFDVNAQNDTLHLRTINLGVVTSGTGSVGAVYLYQGSTQIASASVSNGVATFNNIANGTAGATIPVNTTVPFTVKADVTGVTSGTLTITASTSATQTILSSNDSTATVSGTATGNTQTVAASGPMFTLVGTPTIAKTIQSQDQSGNATTSYSATFNVQVTAVGQNVVLGLSGSTTEAMFSTAAAAAGVSTTSIGIYQNGVLQPIASFNTNSAVTAAYSQPTNTTVSASGAYFTLSQNQTVTVPVTFTWLVRNAGANTYAGQLQGINWATAAFVPNISTFMANQTAWRTSSI